MNKKIDSVVTPTNTPVSEVIPQPSEKSEALAYVDQVTDNFVSGWAWLPTAPDTSVEISLKIDGVVEKTVIANQFRQDLLKAGKGEGKYGYNIYLDRKINWKLAMLEIEGYRGKVVGGDSIDLFEKANKFKESHKGKRVLTYYPDYSSTNPYQSKLVASLPQNWLSSPGDIDEAILQVRNAIPPDEHIFHLHWLNPVISNAPNRWAAERQKDQFIAKLKEFIALGGTLIWTIHNVMSHDRRYEDVERRLCQQVVDLAAKIHVHSSLVLEEIKNDYQISPDKVVVLQHPNYIGVYPNYVPSEVARKQLKIPQDAIVFSFIGQLRPYKGLRELIEAFRKLKGEYSNAHLLISGKPVHPYNQESIRQLTNGIDGCTVVSEFVPDNQLQLYLNASDFVVLPYRNVLTSGSVLNALSFSRPVIAPRMGVLPETIVDGENGWLFDPDDKKALHEAMRKCMSHEVLEQKEQLFYQSRKSIEHLTWGDFSQNLVAAIENKLTPDWSELKVGNSVRSIQVARSSHDRSIKRDVAIIILNYGHFGDVKRLVESIEEGTEKSLELFLVDNDSPNLSFSEFASFAPSKGSPTTYIRVDHNGGYALGNNIGITLAQAQSFDFVWVLNPDIVMEKGAVDILVNAAMENPNCNLFGSTIYFGGSGKKIWSAGGRLSFDNGLDASHLYGGMDKSVLPDSPYPADYITGASLFCRPLIFKEVGLIPEEYFLYFEETDWCQRLRSKGEQILVEPRSELYHYKRSESGGLPSPYYFYYFIRNAINFTRRNKPSAIQLASTALQKNFISAWLTKIQKKAPPKYDWYKKISDAALEDSRNGVLGYRDLFSIFAPTESSPPTSEALGNLERVDNHMVTGWAFDPANPENRLVVAVLLDDQLSGFVVADQLRPDLLEAKFGSGECGFKFRLPAPISDHDRHTIELKLVNGPTIGKKIYINQSSSNYKGRIDGLAGYMIRGWLFNSGNEAESPMVEIVIDGGRSVIGRADTFRPDLRKAGIGNGSHGFEIRAPLEFLDGQEHEFKLRLAGDSTYLSQNKIRTRNPVAQIPNDSLEAQFSWLSRHREFNFSASADSNLVKFFKQTELSLKNLGRKCHHNVQVSVIMPAFNRAETIEASIRSVIGQTYDNFELIIIDDGSTDNTVEYTRKLIEELDDVRVKIISLEKNAGVSAARNIGLTHAKGELIAYLDSDNSWRPDFLLVMVTALLMTPETDSAYCGQTIWQVLQTIDGPVDDPVAIRTGPFSLALLENRNYIDLNCFIHRKSIYDVLGGFNENMRRLVDWELIWRYAYVKSPKFVPVLLSDYFMAKAENQITHLESYDNNFKVIQKAFNEERESLDKYVLGADNLLATDLDYIMIPLVEEESCLLAAITNVLLAIKDNDSRLSVLLPIDKNIKDQLIDAFSYESQLVFQMYEEGGLAEVLDKLMHESGKDCVLMSGSSGVEKNTFKHLAQAAKLSSNVGMAISKKLRVMNGPELGKLSPYASSILPYDQTITDLDELTSWDLKANHIYEVIKPNFFCALVSKETISNVSLEECMENDRESIFQYIVAQCFYLFGSKCIQAGRSMAYALD